MAKHASARGEWKARLEVTTERANQLDAQIKTMQADKEEKAAEVAEEKLRLATDLARAEAKITGDDGPPTKEVQRQLSSQSVGLANMTTKLVDLKTQLKASASEKQILSDQLEQLQESREEQKRSLDNAWESNKELKERCVRLESDLQQIREEMSQAKDQLRENQVTVVSLTAARDEKEKILVHTNTTLEEQRSRVAALTKDNQDFQYKIRDLEKDIKAAGPDSDSLTKQLSQAEETINRLREDIGAGRSELNRLADELARIKAETETDQKELVQEASQLREELTEATKSKLQFIIDCSEEIERLKDIIRQLEAEENAMPSYGYQGQSPYQQPYQQMQPAAASMTPARRW